LHAQRRDNHIAIQKQGFITPQNTF